MSARDFEDLVALVCALGFVLLLFVAVVWGVS